MDIYRIYTISADGDATLQKELHNASDRAAVEAAMALLQSLPEERTWRLEVERGEAAHAADRWRSNSLR